MESRFGRDFSHVRVHTGPAAERSAAALSARAYTIGADVVFAAGQYRPQSTSGRRLLAHELTHVVQQTGGAVRGAPDQATPIRATATPSLIQRDIELAGDKRAACLAKAEKAIAELEAMVVKPDYPLPDYIKKAVVLLRKKMKDGKIKCYAFEGLKHGQFKGDEIRLDGVNPDTINVTTLLHEGVHAGHKETSPKAGKKYGESEGKQFKETDPALPDLLRWKAYTEYWAYRSRFDLFNPGRKVAMSDEEIHASAMKDHGVRPHVNLVRKFDPTFDPRTWKPKG